MEAYRAARELVEKLCFEAPPPLEPNQSYTVSRNGRGWRLDVMLEAIPHTEGWRVSAELASSRLVVLWTGGLVSSQHDWEQIRDELMNVWVKRGLEAEADALSEDDTDVGE
jgi:hypothetical protein